MAHLSWVLFDLLFAVFNGSFALIHYRKARGQMNGHMAWCLFYGVLAALCFGVALLQTAVWLRT